MLTEKSYEQIREELKNCTKPIFFFHDDPDGLASFLLLYRYIREGKGVVVKTYPRIDNKFVKKIEEYSADKVFILDIAIVEQEFVDKVKVPVIWIDHHTPLELNNVKYFNPRTKDNDNVPVSYLCYKVVKKNLWISAIGVIGDWFLPDFIEDFRKKYHDLLPKPIKDPGEILFNTKLGQLSRLFSFVLKGKTQDAMKCVKILTRTKTPYEILEQKTSAGKYLYKKYEKIKKEYDSILNDILKKVTNEKLLVYTYTIKNTSFTGDLSNELLYRFPDKVILIGREKSGEVKCSLRSNSKIKLSKILEKSLVGIDGYGGGHEYACGACIKTHDFKRFVSNLKKKINLNAVS